MKPATTTHPFAPFRTRLLALITLLVLALGLSFVHSPAPAHAADPVVGELGGTVVLRVSDELTEFLTERGISFAPEGLARTLPGDPQTFLLPITFVDANGTVGWAALDSGITFAYNGTVAGTIGDLGESNRSLRPYGLILEFRRGIDVNCRILQNTVDLSNPRNSHTWAARDVSWVPRFDQEDAIGCYITTGAPFAHPDMYLALNDPRYEGTRVNYWTFSLRPPLPFAGVLALIDNLPTVNVVKAGSAVPVKFSLGGYQGMSIFATGYPNSGAVACEPGAPSDPVNETVPPGNSGLSYDPVSDTYTYVWKTQKSWKGCRQLTLSLIDSDLRLVEHTVLFQFK